LRKRIVTGIGLALVFLLVGVPLEAENAVVSGLITNWYRVRGKVPESAYFQVIKKEHQLKAYTDRAGLSAFVSDLPRIPLGNSGRFRVDLDTVPPGEYFLALQRGFASPPILVKGGSPLLIKIPGSFPLNVGEVELELPLGEEPPKAHMIVVE